jgi:uncharacterized phage protein (TIGR01671 family)
MREILFRGKSKGNGKWVEGNLLTDKGGNASIALIMEPERNSILEPVIPETVWQYTEVDERDFSKRKIFRGDIVRCHVEIPGFPHYYDDFIGVVEMTEGRWWVTNDKKRKAIPLWEESGYHWEILGNTTDNPELLEGIK